MRLLINTQTLMEQIIRNDTSDITNLHKITKRELESYAGEELEIRFSNITFGSEQPDNIKRMAKHWNNAIRVAVVARAMIIAKSTSPDFQLDSDFSHGLYLAAQDADNNFTVHGNCGILTTNEANWPIFKTILSDKTFYQIETNPENWVALTLQVF